MQTLLLPVDPAAPAAATIATAARILVRGGLVAFPTETVYGLGASGLLASAVEGIFRAKQRPHSDPLILHVGTWTDFARYADLGAMAPLVEQLAAAFMPGPLTLVLPRRDVVPAIVTAGGPHVALRVPAHPVALALIDATGVPLAAPSANLFSRPSPTTAALVLEDLDGRIDAVLDAGPAAIGVESTILSLSGPPTLLRPGGVALEALEAVVGEVLLPAEAALTEDQPQPAPGMLLKHYSPRARLLLVADPAGLPAVAAAQRGGRLGLLLPSAALQGLAGVDAERVDLGADVATVAARLFKGMRELDRRGCTHILTHCLPPEGLGRAINDRLLRAAEGSVIR